uniref:Metalloenzyme domain-containing protein n=1 Tax=Araucaria cunninghamii TaxID=56994 RepID=A0A0D6QXB3_ARACU
MEVGTEVGVSQKRRVALVLVDGAGDVAVPSLGYLTPLQAAHTPNLDALACAGVSGLMDPVEPGLACGSDTAHLSLLGYDPRVYYRGRGAFESMGAGLAMSPGDIAFKSNFATWDEKTGIVTSRRADRHFEEEGPIFCAALDGMKLPSFPEYEVRVRYATEHRCGVVVKGPKLSGNISGTDPLKDNRLLLEALPLDDTEEAKHTATVVNELSKEISRILTSHPLNKERASQGKSIANIVLLRGCGIRIEVPTFEEKHNLLPCMVAPTKIIAGLGLSLGVDILEAPGATGDYRTLLTSKAKAIAKALSAPLEPPPPIFVPGEEDCKPGRSEGYDFGFLHIKAIDDTGHDKATLLKVKDFEAVDKAVGQLARLLWQAECSGTACYSLCITGDHSTPVEYGDHSYEPVPFTICHLKDFVNAIGGESAVMDIRLDSFNLPTVGGLPEDKVQTSLSCEDGDLKRCKPIAGDSVVQFSEIAAARGCLGRFQGSEMMRIIKLYLQLP